MMAEFVLPGGEGGAEDLDRRRPPLSKFLRARYDQGHLKGYRVKLLRTVEEAEGDGVLDAVIDLAGRGRPFLYIHVNLPGRPEDAEIVDMLLGEGCMRVPL